jgi:hypothetical protein
MSIWYIGCSGYYYRHWKGVFYPAKLPQDWWFKFYSQHFQTLELGVTFYRFPRLAFLETWYAASLAGFRFAVKAPQLITHYSSSTTRTCCWPTSTAPCGRACGRSWGRCCFSCRRAGRIPRNGWRASSIAWTQPSATCWSFGTQAGGRGRCTGRWPPVA